ncbi:transporter substrate-binding domain-containing protein [Parashewanella spongiae]|nr:transporter substrate-binding domain-containing protein [Parashewanella spongiae]MCL1078879.1 transporter substrate-binding domain-containing protein [Parashewanella spongiae]
MKMITLFGVILATSTTYAHADMPTKRPGKLTVCSYSQFKPITYGVGKGFEADYMRHIAQSLDLKIDFFPEEIYEQLWSMPSKAYTLCDVSIGGFSVTQTRQEQGAIFSLPSARFSQSLLIRNSDADEFESYADFNHKRIGVVPGTTGKTFAVQRAQEAGLDVSSVIVDYADETTLLTALESHEIDAIGRGEIGNDCQVRENPYFSTILKRDFGESFSFVVNNDVLLENINHVIMSEPLEFSIENYCHNEQ